MGRFNNWMMSEEQTKRKRSLESKVTLLIVLWIFDKIIMMIMLLTLK